MCRYCRHPELSALGRDVEQEFSPLHFATPQQRLRAVEAELKDLKRVRYKLCAAGRSTYIIDNRSSILRRVAHNLILEATYG